MVFNKLGEHEVRNKMHVFNMLLTILRLNDYYVTLAKIDRLEKKYNSHFEGV